jgi:hypothetical protein
MFSCFARPKSFSAVIRDSGPVFMFCSAEHVFGGTKGVRSRFHVLRSRTHFRRYRGRRFPFSCFARQDSFSEVPKASGPVFIFFVPGLIFGGTEGVGSRFHVLRPDSFSAVPRALRPVFMFCAPEHVFGGTEGIGSRFHVLRSRTRFRRYRGRRVPFHVLHAQTRFRRNRGHRLPFLYFVFLDSFSAVRRVSVPVFMFGAP